MKATCEQCGAKGPLGNKVRDYDHIKPWAVTEERLCFECAWKIIERYEGRKVFKLEMHYGA